MRRFLPNAGAVPIIHGRRNRKRTIHYNKNSYRGRTLIKNSFYHPEDFCRIATCYDKIAAKFLSNIDLEIAIAS